jgi:uncharacterized protein (DUF983 family)
VMPACRTSRLLESFLTAHLRSCALGTRNSHGRCLGELANEMHAAFTGARHDCAACRTSMQTKRSHKAPARQPVQSLDARRWHVSSPSRVCAGGI